MSSRDGANTWMARQAGAEIAGPADPQADDHVRAPSLAARGDGTVALTFYDRRSEPDRDNMTMRTQVWLRHSHDRGETWEEDQLAGTFDQSTAPLGGQVGWWQGITPTSDGFATTFTLATPLPPANFSLSQGESDVFFARVRTRP